ncbi:SRR1-domain-containing protein [Chlamydoabsidia padenii]|nr:SRR1-domain-containing protein [Chlamydoabsidia padenii]
MSTAPAETLTTTTTNERIDGFTKVETKFKYKITPKKKHHKKKKKPHFEYKDSLDWTLDDMIKQLESYREKLIESRFYETLVPLLTEHIESRRCETMICYGIGSMQDSIPARYQLMLALAIQDIIKLKKGRVSIYDPVMTSLDKEACTHYGLQVIEQDEECKRSVTASTLFYMPHCAKNLYSNTISANWTREQLQHVTFIGNDFVDMYITSQPDSTLRRECPYLIPASTLVESTPFPDHLFNINNVFNNLAIQHFPLAKIPQDKYDPFWSSVPGSE